MDKLAGVGGGEENSEASRRDKPAAVPPVDANSARYDVEGWSLQAT